MRQICVIRRFSRTQLRCPPARNVTVVDFDEYGFILQWSRCLTNYSLPGTSGKRHRSTPTARPRATPLLSSMNYMPRAQDGGSASLDGIYHIHQASQSVTLSTSSLNYIPDLDNNQFRKEPSASTCFAKFLETAHPGNGRSLHGSAPVSRQNLLEG